MELIRIVLACATHGGVRLEACLHFLLPPHMALVLSFQIGQGSLGVYACGGTEAPIGDSKYYSSKTEITKKIEKIKI